ncbi:MULTISPECIES: branched-chain amino acid ABC transporter permease [Pseudothermotoga]|jgi:branched-chain amino acid transport system permease protein|uniref:Inner-membrane translocator n=3 Tax=Pseudothermotoga TaxID=1643951 RepID=A8F5D3_PSELT|nr:MULTISPECIES: branched-chain amino acid ABC transporter permease [Pseudothermotoga]ABV33367.1 inner-membrane translocator [Pseudothermotoga lettingae TMO]MDK2884463.1 branched-chain amino acid transport system permease protein [Pseudothermotoga sp.]GLI49718.1 branched-chain amino acid ABC transporter permease [Pseudothermotoga lettingae TMO]
MRKGLSFRVKFISTFVLICLIAFLLFFANRIASEYVILILNLIAINIIFSTSLTLINGITGIFSLGHAGFIAIGAYVSTLLTLPVEQKEMTFLIKPLIYPLNQIQISFLPATIIAGLVAAGFGYVVAAPSLRLIGDYLAIATLGLGETIRIVANNAWSITNGALGLKAIPPYTNIYWSWGWAFITVLIIASLVKSSYGRALKAIREDPIAAKAMGINVFSHQVMSFVLGSFFAGVGGSLWAHLITTIDPKSFTFTKTFEILIMAVLGGLGSISGAIIGAAVYTVGLEFLRFLESPFKIGPILFPGIPGMRMVVLSALLIILMLFWQRGIMGREELSWEKFYGIFRCFRRGGKS